MGNFEVEIKQKVFKNNIHKAVLNIIYTSNYINDCHAVFFKEYNILGQHYNVLRIVRGQKGKPVSPGQIIEVMMDKRRDLTRLVDKLVIMELLERSPSEKNRRKVDITITEKGLKVTDEIETKLNHWVSSNINLSEEEGKLLNSLLDKIRS